MKSLKIYKCLETIFGVLGKGKGEDRTLPPPKGLELNFEVNLGSDLLYSFPVIKERRKVYCTHFISSIGLPDKMSNILTLS